jgi:hypothetical protein
MAKTELNLGIQMYKGLPIQLIERHDYHTKAAKRYVIIPYTGNYQSNQNVWIPNKHLEEDGTIRLGENIDYVFLSSQNQMAYAGYRLGFVPMGGQNN